MFSQARIKLTAFYLLIIMTISVSFSLVIFQRVNDDFQRFERMQNRIQRDFDPDNFRGQTLPPHLSNEDLLLVSQARNRFIFNLVLINILILAASGAAGYFLAGFTLKPIKEMMDEQNRFISDSSHELRTPLTNLRSEIEVNLRNKKLTREDAIKVLESNLEEVIILQKLSDELLELAQGKKSFNKHDIKKIYVNKIMELSIGKTKSMAKVKNVKLENHIKSGSVLGDEQRLVELFVILLDNAIKYSKKNGVVIIESEKIKSKIKIKITNNGIGIDKSDLPNIFERFYRGSESRSESGYGLGLSIAQKIIEESSGAISVESTNNQTTFSVSLPVA